jgi:hypothetical protein
MSRPHPDRRSCGATAVVTAALIFSACGGGEALGDLVHAFLVVRPAAGPGSAKQSLVPGQGASGTGAVHAAKVGRHLKEPIDRAIASSICSLATQVARGSGPTTRADWQSSIRADLRRANYDEALIRERLKQLDGVDLSHVLSGQAAVEYAKAC